MISGDCGSTFINNDPQCALACSIKRPNPCSFFHIFYRSPAEWRVDKRVFGKTNRAGTDISLELAKIFRRSVIRVSNDGRAATLHAFKIRRAAFVIWAAALPPRRACTDISIAQIAGGAIRVRATATTFFELALAFYYGVSRYARRVGARAGSADALSFLADIF